MSGGEKVGSKNYVLSLSELKVAWEESGKREIARNRSEKMKKRGESMCRSRLTTFENGGEEEGGERLLAKKEKGGHNNVKVSFMVAGRGRDISSRRRFFSERPIFSSWQLCTLKFDFPPFFTNSILQFHSAIFASHSSSKNALLVRYLPFSLPLIYEEEMLVAAPPSPPPQALLRPTFGAFHPLSPPRGEMGAKIGFFPPFILSLSLPRRTANLPLEHYGTRGTAFRLGVGVDSALHW